MIGPAPSSRESAEILRRAALVSTWVSEHDSEAEAAENAIDALQRLQGDHEREFVSYWIAYDLKLDKYFLHVEYIDLNPDDAA